MKEKLLEFANRPVLRKIRINGLLGLGGVLAAVALIWVYFYDVLCKGGVDWLFYNVLFGVLGGVFYVIASAFSTDEEKNKSVVFLSVGLVLNIVYLVFLIIAPSSASIISAIKSTEYPSQTAQQFVTLNTLCLVGSIICLIGGLFGLYLDIFAKMQAKIDLATAESMEVDENLLVSNDEKNETVEEKEEKPQD